MFSSRFIVFLAGLFMLGGLVIACSDNPGKTIPCQSDKDCALGICLESACTPECFEGNEEKNYCGSADQVCINEVCHLGCTENGNECGIDGKCFTIEQPECVQFGDYSNCDPKAERSYCKNVCHADSQCKPYGDNYICYHHACLPPDMIPNADGDADADVVSEQESDVDAEPEVEPEVEVEPEIEAEPEVETEG